MSAIEELMALERERCAKLCLSYAASLESIKSSVGAVRTALNNKIAAARELAAAIRRLDEVEE